jgi:hypothetical protein
MLPVATVPASKPPMLSATVLPLVLALLAPAAPLTLAESPESDGTAARPPQPASCQNAVAVTKNSIRERLKKRPIL